jgi:hypothetical protein
MPLNKIDTTMPILTDLVTKNAPDLVFLQMDPMNYIVRQRFLSHKCALNQVEDYQVKGVEDLNDPKPVSWEECIVNPVKN